MKNMIQTVNGPISVKELGVTMCHEHLAVDLNAVNRGGIDARGSQRSANSFAGQPRINEQGCLLRLNNGTISR